jgi:hypothetical protein
MPKPEKALKPLSLYPLEFDEALTDLLKIEPEPKKGNTIALGQTRPKQ